jgi:hypothetical protein
MTERQSAESVRARRRKIRAPYFKVMSTIDTAIALIYEAEEANGGMVLCDAETARIHLIEAKICLAERADEMAARVQQSDGPDAISEGDRG